MAANYYDDVIVAKLQKWIPEASNLRILKPDETKRFFEVTAIDGKDSEFKLPLIALSRNTDIELLSNIKSNRSFDGLRISDPDISPDLSKLKFKNDAEYKKYLDEQIPKKIAQLNVLPIQLLYQLNIYTKTYEEGDELLRVFLFKLINNPTIKIEIPYNDTNIEHIAHIRVNPSISDTSDISERIFSGQFTRWTIQFELHDAFLFNIPYKNNWKLYVDESANESVLELSSSIDKPGEQESLPINFKKTK